MVIKPDSLSKMRIYELARELGLDNKALLDLCVTLGIHGKSSHSNTLSDDEAEKIRRFVLRKAFSEKPSASVKESKVKGEVVTERRVGNLIRRRRVSVDETEESRVVESDEQRIAHGEIQGKMHGEIHGDTKPDVLTDVHVDVEKIAINDVQVEREEYNESANVDTLGAESQVDAASENARECDVEVSETDEIEGDAIPEGDFADGEELTGDQGEEEPGAGDVVEEQVEDSSIYEETAASLSLASSAGAGLDKIAVSTPTHGGVKVYTRVDLDEVRRRHDIRAPKVLGKINLPVVVRPKKSGEKEEDKSVVGRSKDVKDSDAIERPAKGKGVSKGRGRDVLEEEDSVKKKPKRKQILRRDDLLDYDSDRDTYRVKKDKKGRKLSHDGGSVSAGVTAKPIRRTIKLGDEITAGDLARSLGVKIGDLVKKLMGLGVMASVNQLVDFDTASLIAEEYGFTVVKTGDEEVELLEEFLKDDDEATLVSRPPVVTVMGHVDHGKTSLLDAIRHTAVTKQEAGGITQHIGAYTVETSSGGSVTFIDTPGHEAFTAMRGRGAQVTDIVVLVVAADDGVMPQTLEAINHARAAHVPIVVAINKIDKHGANQERVSRQLSDNGLISEAWGGDVMMIPVSAHTRQGIPELLEAILLQSEILELKANPDRNAIGVVVESKLDRGRGPVISVLIRNGTIRKGDNFVVGSTYGRVKAMHSDSGLPVESATPGIPVEILGADSAPLAGDSLVVVKEEVDARRIAELRLDRSRLKILSAKVGQQGMPMTMENFNQFISLEASKELAVIVKGDVQGSVEAVAASIERLGTEEIKVTVLHKGVGSVTENDIQLASASKALVVAFNVRAEPRVQQAAEQEGVTIKYSRIIYELVEDVQAMLKGMKEPEFKERILGRVEVRDVFKVPRAGVVAGSYVLDGTIERGSLIRLLRDNKVVFEGKMGSLRRFKEDVKEVASGFECGIAIDGYSDIKVGDVMEVYKIEQVKVL